jgi:energy-coupling factor transport system ATP-binding protein
MIRIENVTFRYHDGAPPALNCVSLDLDAGESVAVIGPSGSGKTTLLMLLDALLLPTEGRVTVDGLWTAVESNVWDVRRSVGFIFQNPDNQLVSTTVERELAFGMENLGLPSDEIERRVESALVRFRLAAVRDRPPHRLSGGEKQRVAIAAVLAMSPAYLALDEPTSLLDAAGRVELWRVLTEIGRDRARTTIHVTQFPEEVLLSERVVVLESGRLVYDGTPRDLFCATDDLARWGLARPRAMDLADRLRGLGYDVPDDAMTLDRLVEAVLGHA